MTEYYLAVDIGASSGRHILGWLQDGRFQTKEVYRFGNQVEKRNGRLYWNADRLFDQVIEGLKAAAQQGYTPKYIGVDTWAVDYALLDRDGNRIDDVIAYRDARTQISHQDVHKTVPFEQLYARTGLAYQPFNTVYQLYDDKTNGRLQKAETLLLLPDYLNYRLTGEKKQEYTNATTTGLINTQTHTWDREILDALGLPDHLFCPLSQPSTTVGRLSPDIARAVGFDATVLLPATHDTASAVLAAPLVEPAFYLSSGTWSILGIEQPTAHTDAQSRKDNCSNEGNIGYTFRYQKNSMGLWMLQCLKKELHMTFEEMAQAASTAETGAVVDVNDQLFLAPESMQDAVIRAVGQTLPNDRLLRVVYDSLAASYAQTVTAIETNTRTHYNDIYMIGGGSRDGFLNRLTAQATGKTVKIGPTEATAVGNIIMQMCGTGALATPAQARQTVAQSFPVREIEL